MHFLADMLNLSFGLRWKLFRGLPTLIAHGMRKQTRTQTRSVVAQTSQIHWYGLVAVKIFIIPAFLLVPSSIFPAWIWSWVTPGKLLSPISPLLQHCKYFHSVGAERACPSVTLNPHVWGLIPIIYLCTLLLWHCHSIVLYWRGQGYSWPFPIIFVSLEAVEYQSPYHSFLHSISVWVYLKWNTSASHNSKLQN